MDSTNLAVLEKINSLAAIGRYIILSEDEINEALGGKSDGEEIKNSLKELAQGGYIDLKYSGGGMFCVAPLKEYENGGSGEDIPEERGITVVKTGTAAAFFAALAGGALGSVIASLIMAVI